MIRKINKYFLGVFILGFLLINIQPVFAISDLRGRILLQVEDKGQAWYVNPDNNQRYYLGRPADAFRIMRSLGLGVSNRDFDLWKGKAPVRLSGKILLKVEDKGQAYYVDPLSLQMHYLGRPADAFSVMRKKGLGITNADLAMISIAPESQSSNHYTFRYKNKDFYLDLKLSPDLYQQYSSRSKVFTYPANNPPDNVRDSFYAMMLSVISGDDTIEKIVQSLQSLAKERGWSDDETAEFILSFVQYIPYDHAKLESNNLTPYYYYETLYLDKGICSDKTFLAVLLLRQLGYGAAILDFPDINHSAAGIQCPVEDSINNSGYCYVETTNYFPLGVIPQSINGEAQTISIDNLDKVFNPAALGKIEIFQKTTGKMYKGIDNLKVKISALQLKKANNAQLKEEINTLKTNLDSQELNVNNIKADMDYYLNDNEIDKYNALVPKYNEAVNKYNSDLKVYSDKVNLYNQNIEEMNHELLDLYQKNA